MSRLTAQFEKAIWTISVCCLAAVAISNCSRVPSEAERLQQVSQTQSSPRGQRSPHLQPATQSRASQQALPPAQSQFHPSGHAHSASTHDSDCLQPLYSGAWYESDPVRLKSSLDELFAAAASRSVISRTDRVTRPYVFGVRESMETGKVLAAIVPHASYQYSGLTASSFYGRFRGQKFARIFILGPSHREQFHGCALPENKYICTPAGKIPIDTRIVRSLRANKLFSAPYDSIRKEHSIEIQMPLSRHSFGNFSVIPIEVGQFRNSEEVFQVAKILKKFVGPSDLVIVSSDFTHYGPRYNFQPGNENKPLAGNLPLSESQLRQIRGLDTRAFEKISGHDPGAFLQFQKETHDTICGFYPCAILLALLPSDCNVSLLDYENSSGVNRAPDGNMVSYMTIVFTEKKARKIH
jgi:AmmeMemoRadiSam system protein B